MGGSTLVWALLIVVGATIACPVIAGFDALRHYEHWRQFRYMPAWLILIGLWVWLAIKISNDPTLGWFSGNELNEWGYHSGPEWLPIVNLLGALVALSAIGGWIIPIQKYRLED